MRHESVNEHRAAAEPATPEPDCLVLGDSEYEGEQPFDSELDRGKHARYVS